MKLEQQIKLVDEMIAENPDQTLKDFLELKREVEIIERASLIPPRERRKFRNLTRQCQLINH